jgi:DNA-binding MarR family transcriptional regulator
MAVGEALERLARWVRRATPDSGPRGVALSVLATIAATGPQRISDLADRERISQPGMSNLVNRLVEAGLAERQATPADGRFVLVAATSAGLAHLDAQRSARANTLARHLSRLTAGQQRALCASIDGLNALSTGPITEEEQ